MPTEQQWQELWDKQAIAEVVGARYGRALDWLDLAALKDCFHEDGIVDYGFFAGNAHEWCTTVMAIESESVNRFHYVFNILVVVDGDRAEAESNSLAGGRRPDEEGGFRQTFYGSRYLDQLERREGVWRISQRRTLLEFAQRVTSAGSPAGGLKGLELVEGMTPEHELYRRMAR